mgnify:CR=1 FL=1
MPEFTRSTATQLHGHMYRYRQRRKKGLKGSQTEGRLAAADIGVGEKKRVKEDRKPDAIKLAGRG